jgi:hypothetical protein
MQLSVERRDWPVLSAVVDVQRKLYESIERLH